MLEPVQERPADPCMQAHEATLLSLVICEAPLSLQLCYKA